VNPLRPRALRKRTCSDDDISAADLRLASDDGRETCNANRSRPCRTGKEASPGRSRS
jgi:hypothetical protein